MSSIHPGSSGLVLPWPRRGVVLVLALGVLLAGATTALAQELSFTAEVDRTTVKFGESLTLSLTVTQSLSGGGQQLGAPKIGSLPGFDISSQRSAHNMSLVNGAGMVQIQTVLELVPQGPGDKEIPSLTLKGPDGKAHSTQAIAIKVLPPDQSEEEKPAEASTEPDEEKSNGGISFYQGLLIGAGILVLIIGGPILLSQVLTRGQRPSTRWKEKPETGNQSTQGQREPAPAMGLDPRRPREEIEDAVLSTDPQTSGRDQAPVPGSPPAPPVDFEREAEFLVKTHADAGLDFFRAYFDLFRRALLQRNRHFDPMMTPDELMKRAAHDLPAAEAPRVRQLGEDWDAVAFAHCRPSRPFSLLHEDARVILRTIPRQESKP